VTDEAAKLTDDAAIRAADEAASDDEAMAGRWRPPPAQPMRIVAALALTAIGFALYGYTMVNFWASSWLGIHARIPWPAYALIALGLAMSMGGLGAGLAIASPHAKLGVSIIAFLAAAALAIGGARFYLYTMRGTRNPPFTLTVAAGGRFPDFALSDQSGVTLTQNALASGQVHLVMVYRGDYCPFARYELEELTAMSDEFTRAGIGIVAISADPTARSRMLADFTRTRIPLLCDPAGRLLGPLGLLQHHRDAQPANAIPAFFLIDRGGVVRWIFTSPYYREQPAPGAILATARRLELAN
jgi:peroxiredoxin